MVPFFWATWGSKSFYRRDSYRLFHLIYKHSFFYSCTEGLEGESRHVLEVQQCPQIRHLGCVSVLRSERCCYSQLWWRGSDLEHGDTRTDAPPAERDAGTVRRCSSECCLAVSERLLLNLMCMTCRKQISMDQFTNDLSTNLHHVSLYPRSNFVTGVVINYLSLALCSLYWR